MKDTLLDQIKNFEGSGPVQSGEEQFVSNTDWEVPSDVPRPWMNTFISENNSEIASLYNDLGFNSFTIHNYWFQQYKENTGSSHPWHAHGGCSFSNVYFLELPNKKLSTEIISPYGKNIIKVDAEEGDILTFPAFAYHRSPRNDDYGGNKTVIVFNSSVG
jgi:hypothetical protein